MAVTQNIGIWRIYQEAQAEERQVVNMLIENKVQIKAIKTGKYVAGKINGTVMFTEGHFIVYIEEKDCLIDISKIKEFPKDKMEKYSADKIEKLLKPVKLTDEALILTGKTARLFENKETGDKIWLNNKYVKMFGGCKCHSAEIEDGIKDVVFTRYGKVVGLVLPLKPPGD